MTLRLPEERVRALYERWALGELSLRGAAREIDVEARTVMRRWVDWSRHCREVINRRNAMSREQYVQRVLAEQNSTDVWTN